MLHPASLRVETAEQNGQVNLPIPYPNAEASSGDIKDRIKQIEEAERLIGLANALAMFNNVTIEFPHTLDGLIDRKQVEAGCGVEDGVNTAIRCKKTENNEDKIGLQIHWDTDSTPKLQRKGRLHLLDSSDKFKSETNEETRLRKITAHLLAEEGLGEIRKFGTTERFAYDKHIRELRAADIDFVKFTFGFAACVMTAPVPRQKNTGIVAGSEVNCLPERKPIEHRKAA